VNVKADTKLAETATDARPESETVAAELLGGAFVFGQLGQTLDGRIATQNGASKYINGQDALEHLHRLRADVDAVLVGVGTVVADDPLLTVRRCAGKTPRAVVIDPRRRTPADANSHTAGDTAPLFIRRQGDARAEDEIEVPSLPVNGEGSDEGSLDPVAIISALCRRGYRRILVEGGATTLSHFINHRAIDRLDILLAPIILGSGVTGLNLTPIFSLDDALRPDVRVSQFSDGDILYECNLKSIWSEMAAIA
jgi:diaminohydroxyphosphoribosylaminopyrimidine deaminase / 5-amino-6-(5-phosphoribosylamino)uracil reductase